MAAPGDAPKAPRSLSLQAIETPEGLSAYRHPRLLFAHVLDKVNNYPDPTPTVLRRIVLVVDCFVVICDVDGFVKQVMPLREVLEAHIQVTSPSTPLGERRQLLLSSRDRGEVLLSEPATDEVGALEELLFILETIKKEIFDEELSVTERAAADDLTKGAILWEQNAVKRKFDETWAPMRVTGTAAPPADDAAKPAGPAAPAGSDPARHPLGAGAAAAEGVRGAGTSSSPGGPPRNSPRHLSTFAALYGSPPAGGAGAIDDLHLTVSQLQQQQAALQGQVLFMQNQMQHSLDRSPDRVEPPSIPVEYRDAGERHLRRNFRSNWKQEQPRMRISPLSRVYDDIPYYPPDHHLDFEQRVTPKRGDAPGEDGADRSYSTHETFENDDTQDTLSENTSEERRRGKRRGRRADADWVQKEFWLHYANEYQRLMSVDRGPVNAARRTVDADRVPIQPRRIRTPSPGLVPPAARAVPAPPAAADRRPNPKPRSRSRDAARRPRSPGKDDDTPWIDFVQSWSNTSSWAWNGGLDTTQPRSDSKKAYW
ncbi:hypothetical protein DIPPA_01499 [Diplonema papillatum]|nr:hypothetical protein DIPPA_01499 [Diplonema papillatum]